jgi:putative YjhG/YagF family dehydratase
VSKAGDSKTIQTSVLGTGEHLRGVRLEGEGPAGQLPITEDSLLRKPSGHLFGLTQNAGMGWRADAVLRDPYLILSTLGGVRKPNGEPVALGYHTGHWEIGLLIEEAARTFTAAGKLPFAGHCSDPCDGRTQGTVGMFDSLPYRNDAAITFRRLIRSLPERKGVLGVATCDKGLPAMMMALAGCSHLPSVVVPGGVTLPARNSEDAGKVQTLGARFAHQLVTLEYAAEMGCKACGSPGGGCQFLGTAATSQVVAEALGLTVPHAGLCPSGEAVWLDVARRSALALMALADAGTKTSDVLTDQAVQNAMLVHAAFGGSTNLLLHIPAIAHAAGLKRPTVEDWTEVNKQTPRLVDALPNGPVGFPTVAVYMAGGVPEVMLHLRKMGLLHRAVRTVSGLTVDEVLDWWEQSERRAVSLERLARDGIEPTRVIMDPSSARRAGLTSTVVFPVGNIAPSGAVVKATAIDASLVDANQVYHHRGPARVFTSEHAAIAAIKGTAGVPVREGDVVVVIGAGPMGTGMEETYQLTSALKHIPWGKHVPIVTDARFSGVSTGACIGHVGPEALAGGPIGKLRDGDVIELTIDRNSLRGSVNLVAADGVELSPVDGALLLAQRAVHPELAPHPELPGDTRLWAMLQRVSGGTWAGCVYDADRIIEVLEAGMSVLEQNRRVATE